MSVTWKAGLRAYSDYGTLVSGDLGWFLPWRISKPSARGGVQRWRTIEEIKMTYWVRGVHQSYPLWWYPKRPFRSGWLLFWACHRVSMCNAQLSFDIQQSTSLKDLGSWSSTNRRRPADSEYQISLNLRHGRQAPSAERMLAVSIARRREAINTWNIMARVS